MENTILRILYAVVIFISIPFGMLSSMAVTVKDNVTNFVLNRKPLTAEMVWQKEQEYRISHGLKPLIKDERLCKAMKDNNLVDDPGGILLTGDGSKIDAFVANPSQYASFIPKGVTLAQNYTVNMPSDNAGYVDPQKYLDEWLKPSSNEAPNLNKPYTNSCIACEHYAEWEDNFVDCVQLYGNY